MSNREEPNATDGRRQGKWRPRKSLGDTPFYAAPLAIYDVGLAKYMKPTDFKRYQTLLRLGNYNYGSNVVRADLRELEKLDGIAPRTGREINIRLAGYGLVQVLKTHPRSYVLLRPDSWKPPKSHAPRITQGNPLKVKDRDLLSRT
jgi:hypothetical protein